MNAKTDEAPPMMDTVKLLAALALIIGAIAAFYQFEDASKVLRYVGVFAAVGAALAIASFTVKGREVTSFVRDSQMEVRKVVWPTRQETVQTTLIVLIVVVLFAILLWILDQLLGGGVRYVIGTGA